MSEDELDEDDFPEDNSFDEIFNKDDFFGITPKRENHHLNQFRQEQVEIVVKSFFGLNEDDRQDLTQILLQFYHSIDGFSSIHFLRLKALDWYNWVYKKNPLLLDDYSKDLQRSWIEGLPDPTADPAQYDYGFKMRSQISKMRKKIWSFKKKKGIEIVVATQLVLDAILEDIWEGPGKKYSIFQDKGLVKYARGGQISLQWLKYSFRNFHPSLKDLFKNYWKRTKIMDILKKVFKDSGKSVFLTLNTSV